MENSSTTDDQANPVPSPVSNPPQSTSRPIVRFARLFSVMLSLFPDRFPAKTTPRPIVTQTRNSSILPDILDDLRHPFLCVSV
jgi:hypothetical protein